MSGNLNPHYDFALLGTSLPISILSAALSRAGYSILHIDEEEHYGGPWSSLTLTELVEWSRNTALHSSQGKHNVSIEFPAFHNGPNDKQKDLNIPDQLASLNRHFSISLAPTVVPCAGPTIDVLIRSKVASYCTFRLLQKTAVHQASNSSTGSDWKLQKVPSSKEDIFKDKSLSLIDKRKLMKLLQKAGPGSEVHEQAEQAVHISETDGSFFQYLRSKEGANLSHDLATSVAYGVALCSSEQDSTPPAMERIRRHITSIGRYGNAAYLVGQYGGAGEMAQCFCRASAVQGGTFVLGHRFRDCSRKRKEATDDDVGTSNWCISLEGIDGGTRVEQVIGDQDVLQRLLPGALKPNESIATEMTGVSAILLLDRGISFENQSEEQALTPPETGLVIFPPRQSDQIGAVTALQMAEGTFSCPKGMYVVYLSASVEGAARVDLDAREELRAARDEVLKLASRSAIEWKGEGVEVEMSLDDNKHLIPLMEVYYSSKEQNNDEVESTHCWSVISNMSKISTSLDEATLQAENLYWEIVGNERRGEAEEARKKKKPIGYTVGRGLGGVLEEKEGLNLPVCDFFPSEDIGLGDDEE